MTKKYVVPEGMREAAHAVVKGNGAQWAVAEILQAAIFWLSENPIEPPRTVGEELARESGLGLGYADAAMNIAVGWQRRMFVDNDVPKPIEQALRGYTFTREQADRLIALVNTCVPSRTEISSQRVERG